LTYFPMNFAEATVPWNSVILALVVVFFLIFFKGSISKILDRLSQLKFKADKSGLEVSFDTVKAQSELAQAVKSKSESDATLEPLDRREIAQTVLEAAPNRQAARFARSDVLWVDDRPDNNIHERKAFEAIGLRFTLARSTEEALRILKERTFAAIISDMGRPPDPRAGYTLLDTVRHKGDKTPFIIYAGSRSPEHQRETVKHGGQGCTNRPDELFRLVTKSVIEASNNSEEH